MARFKYPEKHDVLVIALAGDESEDEVIIDNTARYLVDEAGYRSDQVSVLDSASIAQGEVSTTLRGIVDAHAGPIVLLYSGHGDIEANKLGVLRPTTHEAITYGWVAQRLGRRRPTLFVNQACNSGSMLQPFAAAGVIPRWGSCIASSGKDEDSYGNDFLEQAFGHWRQRRMYRPREIRIQETQRVRGVDTSVEKVQTPVRWGRNLDYLLFPR